LRKVLESTIAGSIRKLPADLIVAAYVFTLDDVTVEPQLARLPKISFVLCVKGDVKLDVKILNLNLKFTLDVAIHVPIDVETYAPVVLKLVPHQVSGDAITIDLNGENLTSEVLEHLQVMKPIVREQIVREVNARISDPNMIAMTTVDVLALVDTMQFPIGGAAATPLQADTSG
ncbi:MAG: hypothetical protein ACRETE_05860, partial [Stenotrophobium sp.]